MSVIVTTTFQRGQGLDMFSKFVSFQGIFTTQTTTALLQWSFSHVCQRLVSGGQMEVQIYPPLWTVSLGGLVGHNSHREKQVNSGYKCYRWSWKQMAASIIAGCPDLLLHRKKHRNSWIPYLWPLREIQRESKRVWQAHSNRFGCVGLDHQTSSPPVELNW